METNAICPKCHAEISPNDINVAADTALCRRCGSAWRFSDCVQEPARAVDLSHPPSGAWYQQQGGGFQVGATTRSAVAFILVPFLCVWSGFSLGGIYGTQIISGKYNWAMSLFGIPFVIGTILFGGVALMTVCGKVVVTKDRDEGTVFQGVGPLGLRKRFNWSSVSNIRRNVRYGNKGGATDIITIEGDKRIDFGSAFTPQRFDFVLGVLQQKLHE